LAPAILPVATSFLKNSVIFASLSGLKRAPAGISKVPSARADDSVAKHQRAEAQRAQNVDELMEPLPNPPGSVAVGRQSAQGLPKVSNAA
jgi:hypothetical protein